MSEIIRCKRCIMDNSSDSTIFFDKRGYCNYCNEAEKLKDIIYYPNETGIKKLEEKLKEIKNNSKNRKYDCVMGISGGLDSSYLAYLAYKWGLRVLAIHIDDGFDTNISKENIRKLIEKTGFDYEVITPDAEQFNALTVAYMRAGVPNVAIPQDNVLFAFLYKRMRELRIKYFLTGGNFALESILQRGNTHKATDVVNIKSIQKKFGTKSIKKLKFISTARLAWDRKVCKIQTLRLLDLIDYNQRRAFDELEKFCDFKYYGRKHLENTLTAFIQLYWFPKKFGVDKRTSHLSSMIMSNQISREKALEIYSSPIVEDDMMDKYISEVKERLMLSDEEFDMIMSGETHQHTDYKTEQDTLFFKFLNLLHKVV